jgi:DNA-binding transcriptional ArsR family regulator
MSAKWTFWAWEKEIKTAPKKLALLQLANNANDDGKSWYSIIKMATACGVSERTFQRQIQSLESDGLLHVERRSNRPSIYRLKDEVEIVLHNDLGCQSDGVGCQSVTSGGATVSPDLNSNPNTTPNNKDLIVQPEAKRSKFKYSDIDFQCAEWMFNLVLNVAPSTKKTNLESWANTIRLMRESDELDHKEILSVFQWANSDSFWSLNILSADKLRKQFGQLQAKMNAGFKTGSTNIIEQSAATNWHEEDLGL